MFKSFNNQICCYLLRISGDCDMLPNLETNGWLTIFPCHIFYQLIRLVSVRAKSVTKYTPLYIIENYLSWC